jgi:hypothetical protein
MQKNTEQKKTNFAQKVWRLWCLSLGKKEGSNNSDADVVALMRTFFVLLNAVTCFFIISGVIRHWQ